MSSDKLILGTVQLGLNYGINNNLGKPAESDALEILDIAYNNGIRILDTAEAYGDAIEIISKYHRQSGKVFDVISKFKYNKGTAIVSSIKKTIQKLGVAYLYGYMFHSYEDVYKHSELIADLHGMQNEGLIKNIGVSVYDNDQLEAIIEREEFNLIQLPYNLLDNSTQRGALIAEAKRRGKIIHVRSVFLQGLFFKNIDSISSEANICALKPHLAKLNRIAGDADVSISALALQYALSNNNIDGVLFGVETSDQLNQNLHEIETAIASDVFSEVDKIDVEDKGLLLPINWK